MAGRTMNVLITGAGSGLGRGLALLLGERGHRIYATDQTLETARETAAAIESRGQRASCHLLDVTSLESVQAFMQELGGQAIHLLVNNAGLQHVDRLEEFPPDRWELLIDVMLKGTCLVSRALLPGMRRRGFGRIVNIGSIHSLVASPFKSAYVAAKHGIVGLSKTLALETADTDITVNTICPAYIRTPLVEMQIENQARLRGVSPQEVVDRVMLQPMPKHQFITIEEVEAAIEFLAGDLARNITGQCIVIDGGWTIQ